MLNRAVIMGRLTADPEARRTNSGLSVTAFTVAVQRDIAGADGERGADFINVVAWRKTADFVSTYFRKGAMIAVDGRLETRSYETKDGTKRTVTELVADKVSFCGGKADSDARGGYSGEISDIGDDDGDLPF